MENNTTYINFASDSLWAALQQENEQAQANQRTENNRAAERERRDYHNERAKSHALTLESAKTESIKKSQAQSRVRDTKRLQEDHLLPSSDDGLDQLLSAQSNKLNKPKMPVPTNSFGAQTKGEREDNLSIIAILAQVLVLQAKTNSQVWKVLWKQSGEYMNMSLNMAQTQATATKFQAEQQSQATKAQADMSKQDGIVDLTFFGLSVGAGFLDPEAGGAKEADKPIEPGDEGQTMGRMDPQAAGSDALQDAVNDEMKNVGEQAEKSGATALKKLASWAKKGSNVLRDGMKYLRGGIQYAQLFQMAGGAIKGLTIDGPQLSKKAEHEQKAGQFGATAQIAQGYSEYSSQSFSRTEEVRQGSNQNLEYAMNVYKSASDAVTQAISSMFSR